MDFSQITDHLFIGTTPRSEAYHTLRNLGVQLVINMRVERRPHPDLHDPPIPALWLPTFDTPLFPIPIRSLERGAQAALKTLDKGGKVYVHCAKGSHRGVAMGAAILIAQGYTPEEAMELIMERREVADPHAWYIKRRILRFAERWEKDHADGRDPGKKSPQRYEEQ
jgi:dual specificity MAP kinase phosphatase